MVIIQQHFGYDEDMGHYIFSNEEPNGIVVNGFKNKPIDVREQIDYLQAVKEALQHSEDSLVAFRETFPFHTQGHTIYTTTLPVHFVLHDDGTVCQFIIGIPYHIERE